MQMFPKTNIIQFFCLQMLMNVWCSLLVIGMPHASTHLGRTLVAAMRDTLEMEGIALVSVTDSHGLNNCCDPRQC